MKRETRKFFILFFRPADRYKILTPFFHFFIFFIFFTFFIPMKQHFFTRLPLEILLYTLKNFLNLPDIWEITQVCRYLRIYGKESLKKQWKIDVDCDMYKIQTHAAMIKLNVISCQLIKRIKIYDPYAFPPHIEEDKEHVVRELDIITFPPTIEPGLDDIGNENGFLVERLKYHKKRLHSILELESNLHDKILDGMLIHEDSITKSIIDVIFHHAVIVNSISSQHTYDPLACANSSKHLAHAFAAIVSRLLCRLLLAVPTCNIKKFLSENMKTYLVYMEYRLLANQQLTGISCFTDLLGATFMADFIDIEYASVTINKLSSLLDKEMRRSMLMDLKDIWLTTKSNGLLHFIQFEINKTHNLV